MSALTPLASRSIDTLPLSPGEVEGIYLAGRVSSGNGALRIIGATALAIPATGVATGTAGAGTSTTTLSKPTAAANWTAGGLVAFWLMPISGGGAPASGAPPILRPIVSNTITSLTVEAIAGMDATTVFQIVTLASKLSRADVTILVGIQVLGATMAVEIYGVDFSSTYALDSLLQIYDTSSVKISGCAVSINTAAASFDIRRCGSVTVEYCRLSNSGGIAITDGCRNVVVSGCVNSGGGVITVSDFVKVNVQHLTATSSPSRVLSLVRGVTAYAEAACSGGGATPIYLESIYNFIASGGLLTGSGNTGYGLEIAFAGLYNLTGSTITGTTGDVLFDGSHPCTWALHFGPSYGRVSTQTASAIAQTAPAQTISYGSVLYNDQVYFSSRVLCYGIFNPAQNIGIVAAGTTVTDAYQLPAGEHYGIGTCAVGAGVKLDVASALPGPRRWLDNETANACIVYPGGGGTINGAASYSLAASAVKVFICVDAGTDKWRVL